MTHDPNDEDMEHWKDDPWVGMVTGIGVIFLLGGVVFAAVYGLYKRIEPYLH